MASVGSFQELEAWQDARALVRMVYSAGAQSGFSRDYGLRSQIQRSAVSIMANIAEGHGRRGDKESIQFLKIARGSCSETLSHAYVAKDLGMLTEAQFEELRKQSTKTGNKISGLIRYLRTK